MALQQTYRGEKKAAVAAATAVKDRNGRVVKIIVTVAGSAGSLTVHDHASAASGTLVFSAAGTAALGTIYELDIPMSNGIFVTPGTGQTVLVVYS